MSSVSGPGGPQDSEKPEPINPLEQQDKAAPGTGNKKPFFKDMPFSHKEKMEFLKNMMRFFSTQIAQYKKKMHDAEQRLKRSEKGEI